MMAWSSLGAMKTAMSWTSLSTDPPRKEQPKVEIKGRNTESFSLARAAREGVTFTYGAGDVAEETKTGGGTGAGD